jgi:hypothetical protein
MEQWMQALITLTPTESKKLISHTILALPEFQKARQKGIIAMHRSSSSFFLYEALTSQRPEGHWIRGTVTRS